MNPSPKRPCLPVSLAVFALGVHGGDLRRVWEIRFSDLVESKISDSAAPVSAVSFSPDGRHLAAVVLGDQEGRRKASFLLIIDLTNPRTSAKAFKVTGPASSDALSPAISWSPTGDLVALPTVVQTSTGAGCNLTNSLLAVFCGEDRVAEVQTSFPKSTVEFFDAKCTPTGDWEIDGKWELSDASADRHLIALSNGIPRQTQIVVADPVGKTVVHRWPLEDVEGSWPLFANRGKAICALDGTGRHGVAHCWDADSGAEIARTNGGNPHWPMKTALHAKRAILSEYGWRIYFEGWETEVGSLKRWVVWDFGTGKELASWKPKWQSYMIRDSKAREPYRLAISPDGDLVAEGGQGTLILYRIEP
jgi:hypothetical protein